MRSEPNARLFAIPFVLSITAAGLSAQIELGLSVQQGGGSLGTPGGVMQTFEIATCVSERLTSGDLLPGPASNSLQSHVRAGLDYSGSFPASSSIRLVTEPLSALEQGCLAFGGTTPTMPFVNCPEPVFLRCDSTLADPSYYARLDFQANAATNSTSTSQRRAGGAIDLVDDLIIDSPVAQMLELPIHVKGDVLGAESFGQPGPQFGRASIRALGMIDGMPVSVGVAVESVTTIPTTASIDQTVFFPISVPAGVSTIPIDLNLSAEMHAKAVGAFLIAGGATASVGNGSYVELRRLRTAGGGPLAAGTRVYGGLTGTIYEAPEPVPSPYRILPGCTTHNAALYPTAAGAALPSTLPLAIRSALIDSGFGFLLGGVELSNDYGCGLYNSPFSPEDVMLDLPVISLGSTAIASGAGSYALPIPNAPALSGVLLTLHSLDVGTGMWEMSTGLEVELDG